MNPAGAPPTIIRPTPFSASSPGGCLEDFVIRLGLLRNSVLRFRELLEIYRLRPVQTMSWVAKHSKVSYAGAVMLALRSWAFSSWQEKRDTFHMPKVFRKANQA